MSWTQKKLEELYREINRRLAEDPEFAEKLRKDPGKTLEELAGQPLPEGFSLQLVEKDDNYDQTYVLPDFAGEEIAFSDLDDVAGGKGLHYAGPGCHLKQHHEKSIAGDRGVAIRAVGYPTEVPFVPQIMLNIIAGRAE